LQHEWGIRGRRIAYYFESQSEKDHYEDQDVNGTIILGERGWVGVDWISVAQDRDKWCSLVNGVMKLRVT
jgi:hypothetical protein